MEATLPVKADPCPKHFKSNPLPFAVKGQVDKVLQRQKKEVLLLRVKYNEHPKVVWGL